MTISNLHKLFLESNGVSTDTRKIKPNTLFFALKGENFNGNTYAKKALESGAKAAIVDEINSSENANIHKVDNVLECLQQLAQFHRKKLGIPIIALTGSNGKTTTKELIQAVLEKKYKAKATEGNLNNHIGVPLTLLSFNQSTEIGVVEMGANHLKEIEFLTNIAQPDYGYITNFGKAHLEGFGGIEGVIKGKSELYDFLKKENKKIFINTDDELQLKQSKGGNLITFGESQKNDFNINFISAKPYASIKVANTSITSKLIGEYNAKNMAAATCIGLQFNVPLNQIKNAIEAYLPSNNRSQLIEKNNNTIILDAYNANPTSMAAALKTFNESKEKNKIVILGDMFEVGKTSASEHQQIVDLINKYNFKHAFLIGKEFQKTSIKSNTKKFETTEDFINYLKIQLVDNSYILIKGSRGMTLERIIDFL
ncbi:UDP-N-acetylmuramoyl-tripeptide--D-alanyl-D-alanine ligase [Mesonia aquimarina]|uniref:UDP-N-acetylmuramoyl-tripeptide--D-alanyl-D- alanine ligase n=1 Tax=Mesonia aquimarina TaxID=1504967 RepID=UPI000EF572F1|nr:UDP-N-acetylmuramoyl-tripeptide--D-alanyl-D-alanine ligase [Mesonia aquimarina]